MIAGTVDTMAIERSELALVWPANLFAQEARALLDAGDTSESALGFLRAEAFHADQGFRLFQVVQAATSRRFSDDPGRCDAEPNTSDVVSCLMARRHL